MEITVDVNVNFVGLEKILNHFFKKNVLPGPETKKETPETTKKNINNGNNSSSGVKKTEPAEIKKKKRGRPPGNKKKVKNKPDKQPKIIKKGVEKKIIPNPKKENPADDKQRPHYDKFLKDVLVLADGEYANVNENLTEYAKHILEINNVKILEIWLKNNKQILPELFDEKEVVILKDFINGHLKFIKN